MEVSVTPSDMSLRCNVGKKTHREMLRIKRSVSAGYRQVCSLISYNQVQLTSNCFLVNSEYPFVVLLTVGS